MDVTRVERMDMNLRNLDERWNLGKKRKQRVELAP